VKNVRTKRAAKQDITFTYAPVRELRPIAATQAAEHVLLRLEAAQTSNVSPSQPPREA
jgi:hypothetical protein